MLVLGRKVGESVVIADGLITVTVVRVGDTRVRLSVDAPKNISVRRAELPPREELCVVNEK